jgi:tRNA A-37 threonylcarbamoyl transferase component Bud32
MRIVNRSALFPFDSPARPGFRHLRSGRRILHLREDLVSRAELIMTHIDQFDQSARFGHGNRGSGFQLNLSGISVFVRRSHRGGLIGHLNRNLYLGLRARPLQELAITAEARQRGVPVAEPLGAIVEHIAPGLYRGAFLTRAMTGMTLWDFVRVDDDPEVRYHVVAQARHTIDLMHRSGLQHADLNVHNLYVSRAHDSFAVVILDLDKSRFRAAPLTQRLRRQNLLRLRRSIDKVDPAKRFFNAENRRTLTGA